MDEEDQMHRDVEPRMSNTAEILTKQFRQTLKNVDYIYDQQHINKNNDNSNQWSWKRFKQEFLNQNDHPEDDNDSGGELFPKYLTRLQHNFFVTLLLLNTIFNGIVIIVAIVHRTDLKYPGILFLYFTSFTIFIIFFVVTYTDEFILRPKFSRTLTSITILLTMLFMEYGNEFLQINHVSTESFLRIRPIIFIIIATHLLFPFSTQKSSSIASFIVIIIEVAISLRQRLHICQNKYMIAQLTIADVIAYLYSSLFGLFMSRLLKIIIRRAFCNHHNYIEYQFNIYQEQEHQENLLSSCFPRHLIDDVRKDIMKVLEENEPIFKRPFKKLYVNKYDNVSILYADIVNSMLLTNNLDPKELVETLNILFGRFDECADKNRCLRIKLLGDCYYCVAGLPNNDPNHAWNCLQMGLDMIKIINSIRRLKNVDINMRIGIHSGMVLSGIIGVNKWQFDIWSEDSILASTMEHDGVPGCVHITKETLDLLPKDKLHNFNIEEKITNDRVGYLITKKRNKISISDQVQIQELGSNDDDFQDVQYHNKRFIEKVCKIKRKRSFSTILSKTNELDNETDLYKKYLSMERKVNEFIDEQIEQMPLSFKKNFQNNHGINPFTLTFAKQQQDQQQRQQTDEDGNTSKYNQTAAQDDTFDNWKLEKEFLTLPDDFFTYYLFFSLFLCAVIGFSKNLIIPKSHLNMVSLIILAVTIVIILFFCLYSYLNSSKLSFWQRHFIWLVVSILIMVNSFHDLILFNCNDQQKQLVTQKAFDQCDSGNCPYIWSYTTYTILSLTGIGIFIMVNLWLKVALRIIGLICFMIILMNNCSLYQSIIPRIEIEKQWISNVGFDPILSHFYYMFMAFIILTFIDRQIEYIFRLDFKLSKRLQKEKKDAKIMSEINEILVTNILPSYVAQKYLNDGSIFSELYSEYYQFCVVMFASIPNYSDFYSENPLNDNGRKCLQLLNEIICDFDQLISIPRFQKLEKIKTIGSTYMVAAGLQPGRGSKDDNNCNNLVIDERKLVMNSIHFAMGLMNTLKTINKDALQDFKLRVGIAVGPVIGGIVGASKPQYDIWGDTVNVASRMESTGIIGRIQMTKETAEIIMATDAYQEFFTLEQRGPIPVKGKGNLITYLVKSKFDFEETEITYI